MTELAENFEPSGIKTQELTVVEGKKQVQEVLSLRPVPKLKPDRMEQAVALSERIVPSDSQLVFSLGEGAQTKVADFSTKVLDNIGLGESGKAGELLLGLQKTIQKIDPETLKGPQTALAKLLSYLPWAETVQERVDNVIARHEDIKPALVKLERMLGVEQQKAGVAGEQVMELFEENRNYRDALEITKTALILASNKAVVEYEEKRAAITAEDGFKETAELKNHWDDLQRLDRRLYAVEASIALSYTSETQIFRIKEMLDYNFEILGEAKVVMLPAWRTKIALAITAMQANDQVEIVKAFRQMTDDLLDETADLVQQIEHQQADMQKRTFVAAEVIARVNAKMADGITKALEHQLEAKRARDEGLQMITESQEKLVKAMRDAGSALVATSGTNLSAKSLDYDIAAGLLEQNPQG